MTKTQTRRRGQATPLNRHRLRAERIRAGLSQTRLAELSGLSKQQVSALEKGVNGASPNAVVRLSAALRIPVDALLDQTA